MPEPKTPSRWEILGKLLVIPAAIWACVQIYGWLYPHRANIEASARRVAFVLPVEYQVLIDSARAKSPLYSSKWEFDSFVTVKIINHGSKGAQISF